jgi:uncharacterized membrane protein
MNTKTIATTAISSTLAIGVFTATSVSVVLNHPTSWEMCADIVKAGKNNYGALNASHSCSGQRVLDNDDNEFMYTE